MCFSWVFLVCLLCYALIQLLRATHWIDLPNFIAYYTTDFLCLPILLPPTVCIVNLLKPKKVFKPSLLLISQLAIGYSVLFETILPRYSSNYTADPIDVLMYFLGGGFYWLVMMKNHKNRSFL